MEAKGWKEKRLYHWRLKGLGSQEKPFSENQRKSPFRGLYRGSVLEIEDSASATEAQV
jgi:hypothetical protein